MNETLTTLTVEMVAVCLALAIGFVYSFEAWPHPWLLLVWTGGVFIVFSGYRAALFARRRFFPAPAAPPAEEQSPQSPSLTWSAHEPNLPSSNPAIAAGAAKLSLPTSGIDPINRDAATMALPQVAVGMASEDPTAYLDAQELRPETQADLVAPESASIPLFAENTITLDQRTLSLAGIKAPAALRADSEAKTEIVEAVRGPNDPPGVEPRQPKPARASNDSSRGRPDLMKPVQSSDDDKSLAKTDMMEPIRVPDDGSVDETTMIPAPEASKQVGGDKTQALRADEIADRLRARGAAGETKASQKRAIPSARRPVEEPSQPTAPRPATPSSSSERASAPPKSTEKPGDTVQVLDLNELQKLQRRLQTQTDKGTGEDS